jgi:hypothetical protein
LADCLITLVLGAHSLLITTKADAASVTKEIFNETFDKMHAQCTNSDLNYLSKFRWHFNRESEDIYTDSKDIQ